MVKIIRQKLFTIITETELKSPFWGNWKFDYLKYVCSYVLTLFFMFVFQVKPSLSCPPPNKPLNLTLSPFGTWMLTMSGRMDSGGYLGSGGGCSSSQGGGGSSRRASSRSIIPNSESFSTTDPAKLTDHELDCLKEAFSLFDADHDGEITVGELGRWVFTNWIDRHVILYFDLKSRFWKSKLICLSF